MGLLALPAEIRYQILCELLANRTVKVEAKLLGGLGETHPIWAMKHCGCLHPAILCTCQQLFSEGQALIYANNVFDCSQSKGMDQLLAYIGLPNFTQIKHLILEWDQLKDLSWPLSRDPTAPSIAGLESVLTSTWRTRVLGGKSLIWQQNKDHERQLCQTAFNILQRHPKLCSLIQVPYKGTRRFVHSNTNYRVKWRFVSIGQAVHAGETTVDLEKELAQLGLEPGETSGEPVQQMMGPF